MRRKIHYKAKDKEKRAVCKFLWWPKILNGEWRWLERVVIRQHFWATGRKGWWVDEEWAN